VAHHHAGECHEQRSALDLALQFALHPSSHLGHPGLSLKQSLKRFDNVMQKAGITKRQLGVTAHGLRHQFAHEFHVELTLDTDQLTGTVTSGKRSAQVVARRRK